MKLSNLENGCWNNMMAMQDEFFKGKNQPHHAIKVDSMPILGT